jgi:hypothetical protein
MKTLKSFILIFVIILSTKISLFAWTSSNEYIAYNLETLTILSDSIYFDNEDSLYVAFCHINILENDTLIISAGETLKFLKYYYPGNYVYYGINIYGTLLALGSDKHPIILGDPESSFGIGEIWGGIKFFNTSQNGESIISNCKLLHPKENQLYYESGIYCENSSPIIDHCTFSYLGSGEDYGGCSAICLSGQSFPIVTYCDFRNIVNGVAVWCNPFDEQDTINYPSPVLIGCNIRKSVQGFCGYGCDLDIAVLNGGFLENCYLGVPFSLLPDTTLGIPVDTIGDGICNTTSTYIGKKRFLKVDGVVNPRGDTLITGIDNKEIHIIPTSSKTLILYDCYPNPLKNFTVIEFVLTNETKSISLEIMDSKGALVKTILHDQSFQSGSHSRKWYGVNNFGHKVPSGIYFYKLTSDNCTLVKKAIIVK